MKLRDDLVRGLGVTEQLKLSLEGTPHPPPPHPHTHQPTTFFSHTFQELGHHHHHHHTPYSYDHTTPASLDSTSLHNLPGSVPMVRMNDDYNQSRRWYGTTTRSYLHQKQHYGSILGHNSVHPPAPRPPQGRSSLTIANRYACTHAHTYMSKTFFLPIGYPHNHHLVQCLAYLLSLLQYV